MSNAALINDLRNNDKVAIRSVFEDWYGRLAAICARYGKSQQQADEMLLAAFHNVLNKIKLHRDPSAIDLDAFIEGEFIVECIAFIKNIRSEYYVSSTVYATTPGAAKNYDLFEDHETISYKNLGNELLLKSLQQMVPSQRLVFNLHIIEGYSVQETAALLESSQETVKSNLEKSRFNFQKNIEKSLKTIRA
jgi:RNA polymerase sigma-70 factor (ECF subfamily)